MNSSTYKLSAIIAVFTTMALYSAYDNTETDDRGNTFLHQTIQENHIEIVEFLLDQGADINKMNHYGHTPLHLAASCKHLEITKLLLAHGANINETDDRSNTLLHQATQENQIEMVKFLLDQNVDINKMNCYGHTPLHLAATYNRLEIAQLLLDHGANIHAQSAKIDSDDILLRAIVWDHTEMIKLLIKHKAHINGNHLQYNSQPTTKDLLMTLGADGSFAYGPINSRILSKASVLTQTSYYNGQTSDILHIRENLATLEAQEQQTTPQYDQLYKAIVAGDVDAVTSMLTAQDSPYKQYINTQDALGATLLMYAAAREHYDIVKLLLEHGAIPTIEMCNGMNIFSLADTILQNKNDMTDILCLCLKPIAKMLLLHQKRLNPLQKLPRDMIYLLLDTMTHGIAKKYQLLVRCKQPIEAREHIVQTISPLLILTIHYCLHKE